MEISRVLGRPGDLILHDEAQYLQHNYWSFPFKKKSLSVNMARAESTS